MSKEVERGERDKSDLNRSDSALSEERERGKRDKVDVTSKAEQKRDDGWVEAGREERSEGW